MDLSIVIPALNEQGKIGRDVVAAAEFLCAEGLSGQVIVVDDGSSDATAAEAAAVPLPEGVSRRIIRHPLNRGKGYAVRSGMQASLGRYAMFADSGLCVPFSDALRGLELLRSGTCELAHGSRHLPQSVILRPRKAYRRLIGALWRRSASLLAGTPPELTDTQCGFKLYRGDVGRALYGQCMCEGFMFDAEVILRALRSEYRICEFPIHWHSDPDSRLRPLRSAPRLLRELIAVRREV